MKFKHACGLRLNNLATRRQLTIHFVPFPGMPDRDRMAHQIWCCIASNILSGKALYVYHLDGIRLMFIF